MSLFFSFDSMTEYLSNLMILLNDYYLTLGIDNGWVGASQEGVVQALQPGGIEMSDDDDDDDDDDDSSEESEESSSDDDDLSSGESCFIIIKYVLV